MTDFRSQNSRRLKTVVVSLVLVLVGLFILRYISNISTFEVVVSGNDESTVSITAVDENGHTVYEGSDSSRATFRTSASGGLQITATSADMESFVVGRGGGFFRKTTVSIELQPQRQREFIAQNPGSCVLYDEVLYSYFCRGGLNTLSIHTAASIESPSVISRPYSKFTSYEIRKTVFVNNKNIALLSRPDDSDPLGSLYFLTEISERANNKLHFVGSGSGPTVLDISVYNGGLLVFDSNLSSLKLYKSVGATPTTVEVDLPTDDNLQFSSLDSEDSSLLIVYSDDQEEEAADAEPGEHTEDHSGESAIYTWQDGDLVDSLRLPFNNIRAQFCGEQKACVLAGTDMSVHQRDNLSNITGRFSGVERILTNGRDDIIQQDGVFSKVQLDKMSGTVLYKVDGYETCGAHGFRDFFVVCQKDKNGNKLAIKVLGDPLRGDKLIDQDYLQLVDNQSIEGVSIYKNIIHIVPNIGDTVYDASVDAFVHPDSRVKAAEQEIRSIVASLGLENRNYRVINTFTP